MNQTCKVCGEPAAGFHFGAFTCEGCKSFFGRSFNNVSAISECKNNGECVINKKNRTACKACRLRKCLMVGMSKSGSRYGRRSNWFKIHCLLQEQQEAQQKHQGQQHHHQDGRTMSPQSSPYAAFGLPPNGFMHKPHEEDFKTVSTPSTSPASSHISDTPSNNMDLLTKLRAANGQPQMFDPKQTMGHSLSPNKMPKDFFMPMAFPGMPFPLPPTNLAQLFFSGFGAAAAAANHPGALSHHYQDVLKTQAHFFNSPELLAKPFLNMDHLMLQRHIEEERQRAMNSPPASVSPSSPPQLPPSLVAYDTKPPTISPSSSSSNNGRKSAERMIQVTAEEETEQDNAFTDEMEPASKRQKHNPVCGNNEESSNSNATGGVVSKTTRAAARDEPLDLSLTKGGGGSGNNTEHETHLQASTMSTAAGNGSSSSSSNNHRQKYKGADCPAKQIAQTGEAVDDDDDVVVDEDEDAGDDDVQVDGDDQKQTAFFDYFKQTFVRENQFLKIKNNEIYSF